MSIATEAGHWYTPLGEPAYEVMGANGKLRPTTLRDARKHRWGPGVNDVINCAAKKGLVKWQIDQHISTAAFSPYNETETVPEFIARIRMETKQRLDQVPDLGTAVHGAIEKCLAGKEYEYQNIVAGGLRALREWGGPPPYAIEKSFFHPLGFGGKVDIHNNLPCFVVDWKTKEFTEDELPKAWDGHAMQLGAYRQGLKIPHARCAIIYLSTSDHGLAHVVEVSNDELERGWRMFKLLLSYWQHERDYYPTTELVEA